MSKTTIIACDLCGKPVTAAGEDRNIGELVLRGSRWRIDLCDDCAGPLLEKLEQLDVLKCPECGRAFEEQRGVSIHRRKAHGIAAAKAGK